MKYSAWRFSVLCGLKDESFATSNENVSKPEASVEIL